MGNTVFFSQYQPDNNNNNINNNNNKKDNNNNNNNNKEINECLLENHLKLSDAQLLRLKILNDIPINFPKYTIILLYAPPEFNILNIAEFISNKVNLPIIDINLLFIRKYSDHEINYISSSSSSTTMIIDKQENNSQKSIFETRIMLPDCDNGFVVFNYPQTPLQLKHLKEFLPQAKLLPLFLDLDNEAMRTLRNKFDRWVHEPTERSYHVLSRPPESLDGKEFAPTSFNMIDNVTGESLVQLKNDTIEDYKMKILDYRKQETLMISCFDEDVYIIPSCYSKPELHRQVIKCLARAMTNQTTQSNDEFLTEHISNDITLRECSVENKRKFRRNKSLGQGQKSSSL